MSCYALDLDTSIADDIRKNYNPNKIEEDLNLPSLPKILNENQPEIKPVSRKQTSPKSPVRVEAQVQKNTLQSIPNINKKQSFQQKTNYATISKGSKIRLALNTNISDKSRRGTKISFTSKYPVTTTYFTIPAGTVFYGEIADSHRPQLSGNGGLLVLNVNKFVIDGQVYAIDSKVTKANYKKIFFNNIKGKRKYLSSMFKATRPGFRYCGKMMSVTASLAKDGSTFILTPFPLVLGVGVVGGNVILSPIMGLFKKGDPIAIKDGSDFEIVLMQDLFIYK